MLKVSRCCIHIQTRNTFITLEEICIFPPCKSALKSSLLMSSSRKNLNFFGFSATAGCNPTPALANRKVALLERGEKKEEGAGGRKEFAPNLVQAARIGRALRMAAFNTHKIVYRGKVREYKHGR